MVRNSKPSIGFCVLPQDDMTTGLMVDIVTDFIKCFYYFKMR